MSLSLNHLLPGQGATVIELRSADPARLDRLSSYGLVPGSQIYLQQLHPALIFRVGETELSVDAEVARDILVALD
jgi:DtxR family Mn-dependent transcriptional regulator